jgi:hypothetical protein
MDLRTRYYTFVASCFYHFALDPMYILIKPSSRNRTACLVPVFEIVFELYKKLDAIIYVVGHRSSPLINA